MIVYADYIESPAWMLMRWRALDEYGDACEFCGSTIRLHVHHLTYARLGSERLEDLAILCWSCHGDLHDFPNRRDAIETFIAHRRRDREAQRSSDRYREGEGVSWGWNLDETEWRYDQ